LASPINSPSISCEAINLSWSVLHSTLVGDLGDRILKCFTTILNGRKLFSSYFSSIFTKSLITFQEKIIKKNCLIKIKA
jgi:hypothetical protein